MKSKEARGTTCAVERKQPTLWGHVRPWQYKPRGSNLCSRPGCTRRRRDTGNYCRQCHNEYQRLARAGGYRKKKIPEELRWKVFARDDFRCLRCGARSLLRADHKVPESAGGEATLENLQTLCHRCNSRKGTGL